MGRAKAASRDKREREKKSTMRRNLSVWIRPDVLPLVAAVGTGLGLAVFMSVRTLWTHNDVTLSKARPFQYGNTSYERLMPRAKVVQVRTQMEHATILNESVTPGSGASTARERQCSSDPYQIVPIGCISTPIGWRNQFRVPEEQIRQI